MNPSVALCADSETLKHPSVLGLDGEDLISQPWLAAYSRADDVRRALCAYGAGCQAWVVGSDDVDAINVAAALKQDDASRKVSLVAFAPTGSLYSRAQAAGIDEVLDQPAFLARYACEKQAAQTHTAPPVASPPTPDPAMPDYAVPGPVAYTANAPDQPVQMPGAGVFAAVPEHEQIPVAQRGYVMTVVGAGGGVGKSTIALVAACEAQALGYRTVVVDAHLQFGDIHYLSGCDSALRIDEVMATPARIATLDAAGGLPAVLAAPARVEQSEVVADSLPSIISDLRTRFDVVIVNTGPEWNDVHMQLIELSNNTLFAIDQRPSSLRACRHALELCARCGVASQTFLFALNRCSRQALFTSIDISCALAGVAVAELSDGGRVVEELLGAGRPLELLEERNSFCQDVRALLEGALPRKFSVQTAAKQPKRHKFGFRRKKAACL